MAKILFNTGDKSKKETLVDLKKAKIIEDKNKKLTLHRKVLVGVSLVSIIVNIVTVFLLLK